MQFWTVGSARRSMCLILTYSRIQSCTVQQTTKTARGGACEVPLPQPKFIVCWVPPPRHTHTKNMHAMV